ncbi:MAG: hypothetical protein Q9214_000071 [Letrouitia sp. 1 TL-2023]
MEEGAPISPLDHIAYMRCALSIAGKSPPQPTNFRVGALLVDEGANQILSTGYTLELPGNTHAEQCAFTKYATLHAVSEGDIGPILPSKAVLYTTMEPCHKRSAGNIPCVERILNVQSGGAQAIKTVYIGVKEPTTFVAANAGQSKLEQAGPSDLGIENTNIKVAQGVSLDEQQKTLVGSVLDLFAGRPSLKKLSLWADDGVFEDPITKAEGRKQYEPQWVCFIKSS